MRSARDTFSLVLIVFGLNDPVKKFQSCREAASASWVFTSNVGCLNLHAQMTLYTCTYTAGACIESMTSGYARLQA